MLFTVFFNIMAQDDGGDVYWRTSGAREILLDDLRQGVLTLDETMLSAEEAWEFYSQHGSFELVPFSQFKRQLKAHRLQTTKLLEASAPQYEAFRRDQASQKQHTHYQSGRPIFAAFPAFKMLQDDVQKIFRTTINIGLLQQSRQEYMAWPRDEFKDRVYQAVRYWKFVNYLNDKRQKLLSRETKKAASEEPKNKKRKAN